MGLGRATAELGLHQESSLAYQSVLEREPTAIEALLGRGCALLAIGQAAQAATELREGVEQHPAVSECWGLLGRAEYALRQYEPALRAFNQALRLDPKAGTWQEGVGQSES